MKKMTDRKKEIQDLMFTEPAELSRKIHEMTTGIKQPRLTTKKKKRRSHEEVVDAVADELKRQGYEVHVVDQRHRSKR